MAKNLYVHILISVQILVYVSFGGVFSLTIYCMFYEQLLEKMKEERGHVSDIIRQDFADRLVTTEDENRRVKNEISQLRAQHRIDIDRSRHEVEDVRLAKEAELSEVHDRLVTCHHPYVYVVVQSLASGFVFYS